MEGIRSFWAWQDRPFFRTITNEQPPAGAGLKVVPAAAGEEAVAINSSSQISAVAVRTTADVSTLDTSQEVSTGSFLFVALLSREKGWDRGGRRGQGRT